MLEVPGAVAVCFDAPVVELFEARAEALHPSLVRLGPDLLDPAFDAAEARRRLRDPARAGIEIGVALVDQRALAGIGNVYKNEVLWIERVSPFAAVSALDDATLDRLIATARGCSSRTPRPATAPNASPPPAIRPHRAAVRLRPRRPPVPAAAARRSASHAGQRLPRTTYWCPTCQGRSPDDRHRRRLRQERRWWLELRGHADRRRRLDVEPRVTVSDHDLERLAPGASDPHDLVAARSSSCSTREPKESILRAFDLPVIGQYFPDYEADDPRAEPREALASRPMCEHFVARAAEPFRLDELWPFAERLERFGIAGFGWGAAWLTADGALALATATCGRSATTRARSDVGANETTAALVHLRRPSKLSTLTAARHPAVRRPGRAVTRSATTATSATTRRLRADATATRAGSMAARTPRSARAGSRTRGSRTAAVGAAARRAARPLRRPGEPRGAAPPTATPHHYAGNGENPVFTFRLGPDRARRRPGSTRWTARCSGSWRRAPRIGSFVRCGRPSRWMPTGASIAVA